MADITFTLRDDDLKQMIAAKYRVLPADVSVLVQVNVDDRTGIESANISVTIRKFDLESPRQPRASNTSQFEDRPAGFGPYS